MPTLTVDRRNGTRLLDIPGWGHIYKVSLNGDIFYRGRESILWEPLVGEKARQAVWTELDRQGQRVPWRERNGRDIQIEGFQRIFFPLGNTQLVGWFQCTSCNALYTDLLKTTVKLENRGCENQSCPTYKEPSNV